MRALLTNVDRKRDTAQLNTDLVTTYPTGSPGAFLYPAPLDKAGSFSLRFPEIRTTVRGMGRRMVGLHVQLVVAPRPKIRKIPDSTRSWIG